MLDGQDFLIRRRQSHKSTTVVLWREDNKILRANAAPNPRHVTHLIRDPNSVVLLGISFKESMSWTKPLQTLLDDSKSRSSHKRLVHDEIRLQGKRVQRLSVKCCYVSRRYGRESDFVARSHDCCSLF